MKYDRFTRAFFEAALWSSYDEAEENGGEPLDKNYSLDDIDPTVTQKLADECAEFQDKHEKELDDDNCLSSYHPLEQAGHDFWLTRCGHGCGFWDGDWTEPAATILTDASKAFGNVDLYVGDDGKIYAMGHES